MSDTPWTPITERLPPYRTVVLIAYEGGVWLGYRDESDSGDCWLFPEGTPVETVTHWMPMPEGPQ